MFLIFITTFGIAYGHTIDSIDGKYRIEIGWMNEPVVSGETNAIELYISPLIPCPEISDPMKCAESQEFKNGITGLDETLKMQLVYKTETIILSLEPDHNIAGKYYAFVNPTVSGFYQANVLGEIDGTTVSLSMHPPKVDERAYIEFPQKEHEEILEEHNTIQEKHDELESSISTIQSQYSELTGKIDSVEQTIESKNESYMLNDIGYVGIIIAIGALALGTFAIKKRR